MNFKFITLLLLILGSSSYSQTLSEDLPTIIGQVNSITSDDTYTYFGGHFRNVYSDTSNFEYHFTQANISSGTLSSLFSNLDIQNTESSDRKSVRSIVPDGDGGWFIGGQFNKVGGKNRLGAARINSDGTVDDDFVFSIRGSDPVNGFAVDDDYIYIYGGLNGVHNGNVINVGSFINTNSGTLSYVAEFKDGSDDGVINAVASDGAGGWYIGGEFDKVNGITRNNAVHLNSNGTVDASWNPDLNGRVQEIMVLNNDIFLGGEFTEVNGGTIRNYVAKFNNSDGTVDAIWNPNLDDEARSMDTDGTNIYIGGEFTEVNGGTIRNYAAKFDNIDGDVDPLWDPNLDWDVNDITIDGSNVYLGGRFENINGVTPRNYAAKVDNINGTVASWNPNLDDDVEVIKVDGTDVYLGGAFTTINGGTTRNYAAKVDDINGTVDANWNPNLDDDVYNMLILNNDIFIVGRFSSVGAATRENVAKLNKTDGTADLSFSPILGSRTYAIANYGDEILVGGGFSSVGEIDLRHLVRIDRATNKIDESWNPDPNSSVHKVLLDGNDIYIGGEFTEVNGGTSKDRLAKFDKTTGNLINAWTGSANNNVFDMAFDGTDLIIAGEFNQVNGGTSRGRLAKLTKADGTVGSWDPNADGDVNDIEIDGPDLYIVGDFGTLNTNVTRNGLAKINLNSGLVDGSWDPDVGTSVSHRVEKVVVTNNFVFASGNFDLINTDFEAFNIAKLNKSDGKADLNWDPPILQFIDPSDPEELPSSRSEPNIYSLLANGDELIIGGKFVTNTVKYSNIARINSTTKALDTDWTPNISGLGGSNGGVRSLKVFDGNIYVGGIFSNASGSITRNNAAKFSTATSELDESWNPNVNNTIFDIEIDGGNIYLAGSFTDVNGGTALNRLAKVDNNNGTLDNSWNPNVNGDIADIEIDGDYLYLGGGFTSIGGTTRNAAAKIDLATGSLDNSWNPNITGGSSYVAAIKVSGDNVFVGGGFTSVGGTTRNNIAKLNNTDGSSDPNWNPNANRFVSEIQIIGNSVYVGGDFDIIGGESKENFSKLNNTDGSADDGFTFNTRSSVSTININSTDLYFGGDFDEVNGDYNYRGLALLDLLDQPTITNLSTDEYFTGSVTFTADINDGFQSTTYNIAYGSMSGDYSTTTSNTELSGGNNDYSIDVAQTGLTTDQVYYYVINAWNVSGTTTSSEGTFTIYSEPQEYPTFTLSDNGLLTPELTFSSAESIGADGYIILYKQANSISDVPANNQNYSVGDMIGTSLIAAIVSDPNATIANLPELNKKLEYTTKIFPYFWDGSDITSAVYKTDGTPPKITFLSIPTLGEWGMIAFMSLLGIGGVWFIRRRFV